MGLSDKAKNEADKLAGKSKEAAGKALDDDELQAKGKAQQAGASVKKAVEDVKDVFDK